MPSPPLILVADDDGDIRLLVSLRLQRAGYDVITAEDGQSAIQAAIDHNPDLLILDVSMPGLGGHAVCREITSRDPAPPPVIFLSGRATPKDRVVGLEAGAVDYMTKPFDSQELLARVKTALRLRLQMSAIKHEAYIDRTTGLMNRAALDDQLSAAVDRRCHTDGQLGCILIDIDHFKSINDQFGHAVGDEVLREVATRLRATLRAGDAVFRYGGEEFCVIVEHGDSTTSMLVAERALSSLAAWPMSAITVTASAGVAAWQPSFKSSADLLLAADRALYEAKSSGRARAQHAFPGALLTVD